MTFRIHRSTTDDVVLLTLSGDIAANHAADLQVLLDADADRSVIFNLEDLTVVDRAGVLLLAGCEARGARLTSCPAYVREWIDRERESANLHQHVGHLQEEEIAMAEVMTTTAEEGTFESVGGLNIFFRSWRPKRMPRGLVLIVPGFIKS